LPYPLPLPVESLLRRARNAKSPKDRHDTAYFAWEVSVRLAVAARPPQDPRPLARGSVGTWVGALETSPDPLDAPALLAVLALLTEVGRDRRATPRSVRPQGLLEPLPAYRNQEIGHGSTRSAGFYQQAVEVLVDGLEAAWEDGVFLRAGERLVYAESVAIDAAGERRARLLELGAAGGRILDPQGTRGVPESMRPRRLYLREDATFRDLHPWVLCLQDESRERILFFNGFGRRAQFLDYLGGESLRGPALAAAFPEVEEDVRALFGQPPSAEEAVGQPQGDRATFGDYRLLGRLGEGGMGVVYLALQQDLGRLVALKMLPRTLSDDVVAVARFRREVTALARCEHPNVVKILASGSIDDTPYYAMEYVEGADLAKVASALTRVADFAAAVSTASEAWRAEKSELFAHVPHVPRPTPDPLGSSARDRYRPLGRALRDAARGLHHLHEAGVIHRDVKPANLMVTEADRRVVVMDLGLAAVTDATRSITRDKGSILGTLRYMPPEQLQRNVLQLDRRADVYSLGATFYELFTGAPFFTGETEEKLIVQVLREEPVPPRRANPKIPHDVATILRKATDKDPSQRYDSAELLAEDIGAWLEGRPIRARPPTFLYLLRLAAKRHKAIAATIAGAAAVLLAAAVLFVNGLNESRLRAEKAASDATRARMLMHEEMGRQALTSGHPLKAAIHLGRAYELGRDTTALRLLLREALLPVEASSARVATGVLWAELSPDGTLLVTSGFDAESQMWRADGLGAPLYSMKGDLAGFHPDGWHVVTTLGDGTICIWRVTDGAEVGRIAGNGSQICSIRFTPKGEYILASTQGGAARVIDFAKREAVDLSWARPRNGIDGTLRLREDARPLNDLRSSPDGLTLAAVGEGGTAVLWGFDPAYPQGHGWEPRARLVGHEGDVQGGAFAPDGGAVLTWGEDCTARVWDARTGGLRKRLGVPRKDQKDRGPGRGHRGTVRAGAFSPDGKRVVTGGEDGIAIVWDVAKGEPLLRLRGHDAVIWTVEYSPDGRRILTAGGDGTARTWDARTGSLLEQFAHPLCGVEAARFAPDGKHVLTVGADKTARVWEERLLATVDGYQGTVWWGALDPAGRLVATGGGDRTVRMWDSATGARLATLEGHEDDVVAGAFHPRGTTLATGSRDGTARIWDAAGRTKHLLRGHGKTIWWVEYDESGQRLVTASDDRTARVWDTVTGEQKAILRGHSARVTMARFRPGAGSVVATASDDGTARLWDLTEGHAPRGRALRHTGAIPCVAFSPDGSVLATGSTDGTVKIWDVESGQRVATLGDHTEAVGWLAFSSDGARLVTASDDRTAIVWRTETWTPQRPFLESAGPVWFAMFDPSGRHVVTLDRGDASGRRAEAHLWEAATGTSLESCSVPGPGRSLAIGKDGKTVVIAAAEQATVWRPFGSDDGSSPPPAPLELKGHGRAITDVALSPDGGHLLVGREDGTMASHDAVSGAVESKRAGDPEGVRSIRAIPGTDRVMTRGWGSRVEIWQRSTGHLEATLDHGAALTCSALSRDGALAATGGEDGAVRLWKTADGTRLHELAAHTGGVHDVAFSPDARFLLTGGEDDTARIWDVRRGVEVRALEHPGAVRVAAFGPDGRWVVTASGRCVRLWDAGSGYVVCKFIMPDSCRGSSNDDWQSHDGDVTAVAIGPDGSEVATLDTDGVVRVWVASGGTEVFSLGSGREPLRSIVFSPDGTILLTAAGVDGAKLWSARSGALLLTVPPIAHGTDGAAFTADGQRIVSWGALGASARDIRRETRSPQEIRAILETRVPYHLDAESRVVPRSERTAPTR